MPHYNNDSIVGYRFCLLYDISPDAITRYQKETEI